MIRMLIALCLLFGATVAEARPGTATKYRPHYLLGGYKDKMDEPGVWQVYGKQNAIAEPLFARRMAVYRAADLVRQAGFEYMQIIDQKGKATTLVISGIRSSGNEELTIWVRGSHADVPGECRAKEPSACFTVSVAKTMAEIRPFLFLPEDAPN